MTVLDTHVLIWWLGEPAKLSAKARRAVQSAIAASDLRVSAASILEIATLVRRGRLVLSGSLDQWFADLRSVAELHIEPVTADIAAHAGSFGTEMHGDPIDRLVVATAMLAKEPLVSADAQIRALPWLRTIW